MKRVLKSVLLAATLGFAGSAALAQDWEGAYVGAYGGYALGPGLGLVGGWAGYNFPIGGDAYAGVEVDGLYVPASGRLIGSASGRLAYAVSPDALIHAKLGLAVNDVGTTAWLAGAGGEVAVGAGWSLRADIDRYQPFGGGAAIWLAKAGVVYNF